MTIPETSLSVIQWDPIPSMELEAFRLEVPATVVGRIHIYQVPVSDRYPEGYLVSLNTSTNPHEKHEPLMKQSLFTHLCTVNYIRKMDGSGNIAAVLSCHSDVKLHTDKLNPKYEG